MYAVVGCGDCQALWVIEGSHETSECPRCGTTRQHAYRRKFVETEDPDAAREARARLLAERQGHGDTFAEMDDFATMESAVDEAGPSDEEYLAGAGLDPETVADAGQRAMDSPAGGAGGQSREAIVREALRELSNPGVTEVVAYAGEHGVEAEAVETILEKLVRAGEVSESRGTYRLV